MELKINPEYEKILPPLSKEEYEALKNSIKKEGLLIPIVVNEENTIVDGHHRYKICKELGISVRVVTKKFSNKLEERKFVILSNLHRRHLNAYQKAEMGMLLYEIEKEKAKVRRARHVGADGKASELVAKEIGLSSRTFERALKVIREGSELVKEKLRSEEWSINYAYQGYCLLDDVDDEEKKKELKEQFEREEISLQELSKIVQNTLVAYEWLGSTAPTISDELEEKYESDFWTPNLDLKQFEHDLKEKEGAPVPLKEVDVISTRFKNKEAAKEFFKKCGGYFIGEVIYYRGKIDPLKKVEEE